MEGYAWVINGKIVDGFVADSPRAVAEMILEDRDEWVALNEDIAAYIRTHREAMNDIVHTVAAYAGCRASYALTDVIRGYLDSVEAYAEDMSYYYSYDGKVEILPVTFDESAEEWIL